MKEKTLPIRKKYNNKEVAHTSLLDYPNDSLYFKLNWNKNHKFMGGLIDIYELYLRLNTKNNVEWNVFKAYLEFYNKKLTEEMIKKGTVFKLPDSEGIFYIYKKVMDQAKFRPYNIDWAHYKETGTLKKRNVNATEGYSCKIEFESSEELTKAFKVRWVESVRKELSYNMLYHNSYNYYHEKTKETKIKTYNNDN